VRIAVRRDAAGENAIDALLYGAACMLGKLPQGIGMLRAWRLRKRLTAPALIEYK